MLGGEPEAENGAIWEGAIGSSYKIMHIKFGTTGPFITTELAGAPDWVLANNLKSTVEERTQV